MLLYMIQTCDLTQREALQQIYQQTDGEYWTKGKLWNSFIPICFWEGITCRNGVFEKLNLDGFGLTGTLPEVFGCFPNIKYITLANNFLQGPIPETFGELTYLQNLEATGAGFVGEIPKSLYNLEFLQYIQLGENGLTGAIPAEVQNLKELHQFDVHCNDIEGKIPDEFAQLPGLKELNFECNQKIDCDSQFADDENLYFFCQTQECHCQPEF